MTGATYRKYAEECRRLATTASENDRKLLLEQAAVWLKLAEEAEKLHQNPNHEIGQKGGTS
jgi:hypothetical protein